MAAAHVASVSSAITSASLPPAFSGSLRASNEFLAVALSYNGVARERRAAGAKLRRNAAVKLGVASVLEKGVRARAVLRSTEKARALFGNEGDHFQVRRVLVEASTSGSNGRAEKRGSLSMKPGARERRLQKVQEEKRLREGQGQEGYPPWASILENACKDDVELREIIGDSFGNPEEMRKRVEERVRKKGRDVLSPLTGSVIPMTVTFKADFDATDANVWLELYGSPSDKDMETIGSVLRSWYLLGRLGAFNSMNMQLTQLPIDARLTYSTDKAAEALPSLFHNIADLEFQDNWGRFWVDFGTSDPVAMDVLINALSSVNTDHVGIKQLVFGGERLGDWSEGMVDPEDGYRCYKI